MKETINKIPVLRVIARGVYGFFNKYLGKFNSSDSYWKSRYEKGGNSGVGSYGKFATFKAEVLNKFVEEKGIHSVIEFGSGDGNQLLLLNYPKYSGFEISEEAIELCNQNFSKDTSKEFFLNSAYDGQIAELTLSLDVIYHLVEDETFNLYMELLFNSSSKFVIIYASNLDEQFKFQGSHVRPRKFSSWIDSNQPDWKLVEHIPNQYPYDPVSQEGSFADFYIYEKY